MRHGRVVGLLGLLVILPFVLLSHARDAGFVADDFYLVHASAEARPSHWLTRDWGHPIVPGTPGYRPAALASFAIDRAVWGEDPSGYRTTNYLLHGLASAWLALLAMTLGGSVGSGLVVGLLFAVHPVHHENIYWISARTHLLAAVFALPALCVAANRASRPRARDGAIVGLLFALALGSYEPAIVLPLALSVVALASSTGPRRERLVALAHLLWPAALVAIAYLALRWGIVSDVASDLHAFSPERVVRNAFAAAGRLATIPKEVSLAQMATPSVVVTVLMSAGAFVAGLARPATRRTTLAGVALAVIFYLPFVAADRHADRFVYLTSTGFAIMVAAGLRAAADVVLDRLVRVALGVALLTMVTLWTGLLWRAGREWHEAGTLARSIIAQLHALEPDPPDGAALEFFGVPATHGQAWVYLTYFEREVQRSYCRDLVVWNRPDAPAADVVRRAVTEAPGHLVFWWDRDTLTLHRAAP